MRYGLTEMDLQKINTVFYNHPRIFKVVLFGSRAKGSYTHGSDIDLALFSDGLAFQEWLTLLVQLEELELAYKIYLLDIDRIQNIQLMGHIDRVGKIIFNRSEQKTTM